MPDITYDVGRVSFVMKGAWNLATNYEKLDAVSYNGSLYIAKQDVPGGTAITNTTYWQLAAEKGEKGDTGGVDSVNGQQGDVWFPDSRQLISDGYTTDTAPFLMKGNDSDSDRFEHAKKLGNTVCVNQLVDSGTSSVTIPSGRKYYAVINGAATIGTSDGSAIAVTGGQDIVIDLTLWFGSNDRIPADLLAHPENWGRYYAGSLDYNAGTLDSADGTVLKSIGRNVWDEEWQLGYWDVTTGLYVSSSAECCSKNIVEVIPNTDYYFKRGTSGTYGDVVFCDANGNAISFKLATGNKSFTTPSGCHFIKVNFGNDYGTTYKHDITISLYYSGESGYSEYYPYTVLAEVDTGSEVLRSAGAVADEKTPDGTITRKVKELTVTQFTGAWGPQTNGYGVYLTVPDKDQSSSRRGFVKSNRFTGSFDALPNMPLYSAGGGSGAGTTVSFILPSSVTSLAEANTWLTNNPTTLYYVLATPTTEQGTAFNPIVATVKGGVLSWTNTKGIPVGQESHWFENLRKRVEDRLPDPPSADGTYRLTCTISGGVKVYSWEA